jgi:hypothetical protein
MDRSDIRRWVALGTFAFFGVSLAFLTGATAGAALNGKVNAITIGSVPARAFQSKAANPAPVDPTPTTFVASK